MKIINKQKTFEIFFAKKVFFVFERFFQGKIVAISIFFRTFAPDLQRDLHHLFT